HPMAMAAIAEDRANGNADAHRQIRRHREHVGLAANAVRTEITTCHGNSLGLALGARCLCLAGFGFIGHAETLLMRAQPETGSCHTSWIEAIKLASKTITSRYRPARHDHPAPKNHPGFREGGSGSDRYGHRISGAAAPARLRARRPSARPSWRRRSERPNAASANRHRNRAKASCPSEGP